MTYRAKDREPMAKSMTYIQNKTPAQSILSTVKNSIFCVLSRNALQRVEIAYRCFCLFLGNMVKINRLTPIILTNPLILNKLQRGEK
jgi:hypothetical protein